MAGKKQITAKRTVGVSTLVSLSDIIINLIAAVMTGSVVLVAQALQGFADLTTTLMLLIGVNRSKHKPTQRHPFGYGRELFFWVLLASLFTFLITGGVALIQGINRVLEPMDLENTHIAYIILTFGLITNGYSLSLGLRRMKRRAGKRSMFNMLTKSSLVETKMSMLVDLMGTVSALLGLVAIGLFSLTGDGKFDGYGAIAVGLLTALGALFVIIDLRDLIIGRSPGQDVVRSIKRATLGVNGINDILELNAVVVGSGEILVIVEVHFVDDLKTDQIEKKTDQIKAAVKKAVPQVIRVQVEAETPDEELIVE